MFVHGIGIFSAFLYSACNEARSNENTIEIQLCMSISHFAWMTQKQQLPCDENHITETRQILLKRQGSKKKISLHETNQIECIEMFYMKRTEWHDSMYGMQYSQMPIASSASRLIK